MADDKTKRGSPDSKRLNKGEPYELAYARKKATVRGAPHPPTEKKTVENTAPRTMKAADAVDLLTDDHLQVSALFKQYEKLAKTKASVDQRRRLAATICGMLKTHTAIEEEILYPAARKARVEAALLDEADIEHASAKELIAQIESGHPGDDHYDARVKVLGEYITHHVVEEHTQMFPKCRRASMDLVALRARMQARKAELDSSGPATAEEGVSVPIAASAESAGILSRISESLFSARNP